MRTSRQLILLSVVIALVHMSSPSTAGSAATYALGPKGEVWHWLVLGYLPLRDAAGLSAKESVGKGFQTDPFAAYGGESCLEGEGGAAVEIGGANYVWRLASAQQAVIPLCYDTSRKPVEKTIAYLFCIIEASSANIRRLAQKYNCELAEVREEWKTYLADNPDLKIADFLRDSIHLNRRGCVLMAALVERHFRTTTLYPSCWAQRVRRYDALRFREDDKADEITFTGDGWQATRIGVESSSTNDALHLQFSGNRIDLVLPPCSGSARILVDGQPLSEHNLYHATRPRPCSGAGASHLSSLTRVFEGADMVPEKWTLTFTELELDEEGQRVTSFRYRVEGSVTGPDGEGDNESEFVSNSGRIRIRHKDFFLSPKYAKPALKPGLTLAWEIVPDFIDVVQGSAATPYKYVTVADGLPNGKHELTIVPVGGSRFLISAVEIHRPPLGRGVRGEGMREES